MCLFTCSPRPPTLSQRHMDLHVWSYPRLGYIFQVSSKSVQGFRSPRGQNLPFPITLAIRFYNSLYTTVQAGIICRSQVLPLDLTGDFHPSHLLANPLAKSLICHWPREHTTSAVAVSRVVHIVECSAGLYEPRG